MATSTPARRSWFGRIFRLGFPQIVVLLMVGTMLAYRNWTPGELEAQFWNFIPVLSLGLGSILLAGWFVFASGVLWRITVPTVVLVLGGGFGYIALGIVYGWVLLDGNMGFLFRSPFVAAAEQLEADRARQERPEDLNTPKLVPTELDSPGFRGRDRTGMVAGPSLNRDWERQPPRELWKQRIGPGNASFATANGFLVTIEQRRDQEAVVCYDAATGYEVWVYTYPARFFQALAGEGPHATPTIHDDGLVYSLGATGHLACLDGATGKPKWTREILDETDNLQWGMAGSPLIVGDRVIVNPGAQTEAAKGKALQAFDRLTGERVWASGDTPAGYSSPMLGTLGGVEQILLFDGAGLAGYDPVSGQRLWFSPWITNQGINVAQPIVLDEEHVFIASGYGVGGGVIKVTRQADGWKAEEVKRTKSVVMRCKFASPIKIDDYIYGLNDGNLECVAADSLGRQWKDDRRAREGDGAYNHGQMLYSDGLLVITTEYGELVLVEPNPNALTELARLKVLEGVRTWNTPTLADGIAYVRNGEWMAAYDLRAQAK